MRRRIRYGGADGPTKGDEGPRVRGMQRVLNDLGYHDGTPLVEDGRLGDVTAAALGRAQAELGVTGEDGTLGPATRAALRTRRDPPGPRRRTRTG